MSHPRQWAQKIKEAMQLFGFDVIFLMPLHCSKFSAFSVCPTYLGIPLAQGRLRRRVGVFVTPAPLSLKTRVCTCQSQNASHATRACKVLSTIPSRVLTCVELQNNWEDGNCLTWAELRNLAQSPRQAPCYYCIQPCSIAGHCAQIGSFITFMHFTSGHPQVIWLWNGPITLHIQR